MLRKLVPCWLARSVMIVPDELVAMREFLLDGWRYQRSTSVRTGAIMGDRLEARVTASYHQLEKGLTFATPKRPFGLGVARNLTSLLARATRAHAKGSYIGLAEDALAALDLWNETGEIDETVSPRAQNVGCGVSMAASDLRGFFQSRRSVRNMDPTLKPSREIIETAIGLACETPSVCNRQASRVHVYMGEDQVRGVLALQNGNRGFGEGVPVVIVVTVNRALFMGPSERNQRWIDGALFAMTLVWALHGLGLATCMLNWCELNSATGRLRRVAEIPQEEDVIVMIAVGYGARGFRVARSERRTVTEVANFHGVVLGGSR